MCRTESLIQSEIPYESLVINLFGNVKFDFSHYSV